MKFSESLKKNTDFQKVYRQGTSAANKYLVMYVLENHLEKNRIGISVSKKVGNSVVRHHLCRLVREAYRLKEESFTESLVKMDQVRRHYVLYCEDLLQVFIKEK